MIASITALMLSDPRYGTLPPREKVDVGARIEAMQRIDQADNKVAAINAETRRMLGSARYRESGVRKLYYQKWLPSGRDWYAMVKKSRLSRAVRSPEDESGLSKETVEHWHQLCFRFGGKHKTAHRQLERDYRDNKVPGFPYRSYDLPRGLSYPNLMRRPYRPTNYADKVASIGVMAAREFVPSVLSTRKGLHVGECYLYDDMWHDNKVTVLGQMGARRVMQFHCMDMLSACNFARGYKAELLNDATGRFERLKVAELRYLLVHSLAEVGVFRDRCWLIMEHGTTTVEERIERLLYDWHGIRIIRGGIGNSALCDGLYTGPSRGNFKIKAPLESSGNLQHNEHADRLLLPGNTGSNSRLNAPEELTGRERAELALSKAALALSPEDRELLRHPFPPLSRFIELSEHFQERINQRTEHDLEGWDAFITSEYRLHPDQPWLPSSHLLTLPETAQAALVPVLEADKRLTRSRRLSPREVFDAGRADLVRMPAHLIPELLGVELGKERKVGKDGRFAFEDQDIGFGDHVFDAVAHDEQGHTVTLQPGEAYATFISAVNPDRLHLCDARGRYVGWCDRAFIPSKADPEGIARAMGRAVRAEQELLAPVVRAARPFVQQRKRDAEINAAILAEGRTQPARPRRTPAAQEAQASANAELAAAVRAADAAEEQIL